MNTSICHSTFININAIKSKRKRSTDGDILWISSLTPNQLDLIGKKSQLFWKQLLSPYPQMRHLCPFIRLPSKDSQDSWKWLWSTHNERWCVLKEDILMSKVTLYLYYLHFLIQFRNKYFSGQPKRAFSLGAFGSVGSGAQWCRGAQRAISKASKTVVMYNIFSSFWYLGRELSLFLGLSTVRYSFILSKICSFQTCSFLDQWYVGETV